MPNRPPSASALRPAKPSESEPDFVQLVDVVKKFGATTAVDHVSLSIRRKELFALLGSSGCGKSTLLRLMAGLETPDSGRIIVDGQDITQVPPYQRPVNMMFQSYALFPHMTVEGNAAYGLKREGAPKREIKERVAAALELVQMTQYAQRKPHQLSGGQQQRVALARSLVKRPKLLLLDEPMSALDKKIRQQTQFELGNILYSVGVTCVLVTHDQEEAMTMADRLAVMNEGRFVQVGTPNEVYEAPTSRFAAEFIGSTNLFEASLAGDESRLFNCKDLEVPLQVNNPMNARMNPAVHISLRPERITMSFEPVDQPTNWALGTIDQYAYMGSYTVYYVRLKNGRVMAVDMPQLAVRALARAPDYGDTVTLSWGSDHLVVLTR
ncbi:MAG TPA: polyamine ABC transporter ATP-binding protein [Burkholderiaceae bacterium]|nr:polyamine ABC transporter ATP-binding protein [Burkholderiaceae bacterium]